MPTGPWATSEQLEWLKDQRVAFSQAQESKKLPMFWVDIYWEFFIRWPDQASETEAIVESSNDGGNRKGAKETQRKQFDTTPEWVAERKKVCLLTYISGRLIDFPISKSMRG